MWHGEGERLLPGSPAVISSLTSISGLWLPGTRRRRWVLTWNSAEKVFSFLNHFLFLICVYSVFIFHCFDKPRVCLSCLPSPFWSLLCQEPHSWVVTVLGHQPSLSSLSSRQLSAVGYQGNLRAGCLLLNMSDLSSLLTEQAPGVLTESLFLKYEMDSVWPGCHMQW